jgi:putative transcriptional regulator
MSLLGRLDGEQEGLLVSTTPDPLYATGVGVLGTLCVPEPLRTHLSETAARASWIAQADGIEILHLDFGKPPVVAEILRMKSGFVLQAHRHSDQELILVLKEMFSEERSPTFEPARRYAERDFGEFEAGSIHAVVAGVHGCVCYTVLAGPVEWLSKAP